MHLVSRLYGHRGAVPALDWTDRHQGDYLVTACSDGLLRLWRVPSVESVASHSSVPDDALLSASLIASYKGHALGALDVSVCPEDSTKMLSCGMDRDILLWDVAQQKIVRRLRGHDRRVNCVRFVSSGNKSVVGPQLAVSGGFDSTVRLWDCRVGKEIALSSSITSTTDSSLRTASNSAEKHHQQQQQQQPSMISFSDAVSSIGTIAGASEYLLFASSLDGKMALFDIRAGVVHVDQFPEPISDAVGSSPVRSAGSGWTYYVSLLRSGLVVQVDGTSGTTCREFCGRHPTMVKFRMELQDGANHVRRHHSSEFLWCGTDRGTLMQWDANGTKTSGRVDPLREIRLPDVHRELSPTTSTSAMYAIALRCHPRRPDLFVIGTSTGDCFLVTI